MMINGMDKIRKFNSEALIKQCRERAEIPEEISKETLLSAAKRIEILEQIITQLGGEDREQ